MLVVMLGIVALHLAAIPRPDTPLFDELHYVPDGRRILTGEGSIRNEHPPLARLIIASGMALFGDNPWGWRLPAVILSSVSLIALYDICRRLGTSQRTALIAVLLLGTDNLMFIHSGIAMLDIYEVVFAMFAFWFYLRGTKWWWAAAVMVGLAGLCKFNGVLAIIPIGLHWLFIGYKQNMGAPPDAEDDAPDPTISDAPAVPQTLMTEAAVPVMVEDSIPATAAQAAYMEQSPAAEAIPDAIVVPVLEEMTTKPKLTFWQTYSRPMIFLGSMLLAPLAFFLFYGIFEMIIRQEYVPYVVWGQWDQGIVGLIRNALSSTSSIKFPDDPATYTGAFVSKPWEWVLSPTGSLYFYQWLFDPNFDPNRNVLLPYWYTPAYSGIQNPSMWLAGLVVIPLALWKTFKKHSAWTFVICWIIGTWAIWIPLFLATNRITYMFYYLPTIGAVAIGAALIITGMLKKAEAKSGFGKHALMLGIASLLLFHLLCFCVISPLQLWVSIPICTALLIFMLAQLKFGWQFLFRFTASAVVAALVMRFVLYEWFRSFLVSRDAPWGHPEVSMLWTVSAIVGMIITWGLYLLMQRLMRDNRTLRAEEDLATMMSDS